MSDQEITITTEKVKIKDLSVKERSIYEAGYQDGFYSGTFSKRFHCIIGMMFIFLAGLLFAHLMNRL